MKTRTLDLSHDIRRYIGIVRYSIRGGQTGLKRFRQGQSLILLLVQHHGTHNDQDDLRRRSVIECLARYQLPLRHHPCNNSRSSEYKVNISCHVSTLYHYLFFRPIRLTEGDQRHYVARGRSSYSFLLCHFRSPYHSLSTIRFVCALL